MMKIKCYFENAKLQSIMYLFCLFLMIIVMSDFFKITYLVGIIFWTILYYLIIYLTNKFVNKKYITGISLLISIVILMLLIISLCVFI